MAINIPIITSLEDTGIKNAKAAFNDFKSAVGKAEGGMGKFKAGSKVALDAVKANAAGFALAGGSALASFATKAISAFQDLALGAGLFADATGLAVEDASRYMEVAGDLGISVDTVKNAIGRLNKTIGADPDKVRKLGVDMVYLNDGSLDVNETFINTIERIKGIKDPAEKATVAAQLLGKGWQGMAELINLGSEELRKSLDSVADAQVISDKELAKAKEFRDTMDELGDMWNGFVIEAGGYFVDTINGLDSWQGKLKAISPVARVVGFAIDGLTGLFSDNDDQAKETTEQAKRLGDAYAGYVSSRLAESRQELALLNGELEDQDDGLAILTTAWQTLLNTLDTQETFDNLDASLERVFEAGVKAFGGGAEEIRDFNSAQKDAIEQIADLAIAMDLSFGEQNKLKIFVDSGDLAGARDLLESLQRIANMGPIYDSGIARAIRGRRAMGGPVAGGSTYLVGERGPELFTPTSSGNITANSSLGGGGNTVTINVNGGDPMQVVKALQTYVRTIGPVPVNTRTM